MQIAHSEAGQEQARRQCRTGHVGRDLGAYWQAGNGHAVGTSLGKLGVQRQGRNGYAVRTEAGTSEARG